MSEPLDPQRLAATWIDLWEEQVRALLSPASLAGAIRERAGDGTASGAAPAAAAPRDGDGDVAELRRRIDALEQRLAALERSIVEPRRRPGGGRARKPPT